MILKKQCACVDIKVAFVYMRLLWIPLSLAFARILCKIVVFDDLVTAKGFSCEGSKFPLKKICDT